METITEKAADRIKALETQENLEKLERLNFYFVNQGQLWRKLKHHPFTDRFCLS
ncbi:hypothetical protein J4414_03700 [Candidatus Woesearchaeota archaeon]|nr:hypothetical protein [Candidatus Woesearchaeota archaeon]